MKKFLLLITIFFISSSLKGQEIRVSIFQVEQGLPSNLTKAIAQDDKGFIWIGTDVGVLRFDGKNFLQFNNLPSPFVKSIRKSRKDLFVVTDRGIIQVNNKIDTVVFLNKILGSTNLCDSLVFYPKTITVIDENPENFWVSETQSILHYNRGILKRYLFEEKFRTASFLRSFSIIEDGFGGILASSQQGHLFYFNKAADQFIEIDPGIKLNSIWSIQKVYPGKYLVLSEDGVFELRMNLKKEIISFKKIIHLNNISTLKIDQTGTFFIGTWNMGLYKAIYQNGKYNVDKVGELPFRVINDIFINDKGDIWVSADEGVALLQYSYFQKLKIDSSRTYIQSVIQGNDGQIYASDGSIIFNVIKKDDNITYNSLYRLNEQDDIMTLAQKDKSIWFGTSRGYVYELIKGKVQKIDLSMYGRTISYLFVDSKKNLWVSQKDAVGLFKITPNKKIIHYDQNYGFQNHVSVIKQGPDGKLYAGSGYENSYLYEYEPSSDKFLNISKKLPKEVNNQFNVEDICFENEKIWLATNNGLFTYTKDSTVFYKLNRKDPIEVIKAVKVTKDGGIWVGTNLGLIKVYKNQILVFDEFNGLPSKTISNKSIIEDANHHIFVGTASGLGYAKKISQNLKKTPSPVFLSLKINGEDIKNGESVFPNNAYFQASFITLSFPSRNLIYQYKIQGLQEDWNTINGNPELSIPHLSEGNYQIKIRALQQGEYIWSDPLVYEFSVKKDPWFTWWAFILYTLILFLIFKVLVTLITKRLKKEKLKLEAIIQDRTSEIIKQKEEIKIQRDAIKEKSEELEKALNEISEQNKKLEILNATKDKFFSIVAHDLKGPLNSLTAFSSLLANYTETMTIDEIKSVSTDLNKAVKNTVNLAENLLTWARAQMDNLQCNPKVVDINNLIMQNLELLEATARNKNLSFANNLEEGLKTIADEDHIRFIIRNLLSNSIKFSLPNGKPIIIKSRKIENQIEVSIQDFGIGMSDEQIEKIFSIGSKVSTPGTAGEKGTGLGLLLCKEFLIKNEGQLKVHSEPGVGSRFAFTIKLFADKPKVVNEVLIKSN
jgi:signal transduction histidine kinase/ligand-binding sensor domain-containing protein